MVALSVSISAITSPATISSPSCLCHFASVPSVMVGESAGIKTSIVMAFFPRGSAVADGAGRFDDVVRLRQRELFKIGGIGQGHVDAGDPPYRRVEPIEG